MKNLVQKLRKENDSLRDEINFHYKPMLSLCMALLNAPKRKKPKKAKR